MTLFIITRSGNILCILFLLLLVSCDYTRPLQVNQKRAFMLKNKDCSVLVNVSLFREATIYLKHQSDKSKCQFNFDSLKLFVEGTQENIILDDCKYMPCVRIVSTTDTTTTVQIPINKTFSLSTVYLLPCNYISCNGKTLTDTLRIQIPPRVKR